MAEAFGSLSHSLSFVLLIVHLCWIFLLFGFILSLYQVNMRSMRTLLISCAHYYSRVIFISIYSIFVCFFFVSTTTCLDRHKKLVTESQMAIDRLRRKEIHWNLEVVDASFFRSITMRYPFFLKISVFRVTNRIGKGKIVAVHVIRRLKIQIQPKIPIDSFHSIRIDQ